MQPFRLLNLVGILLQRTHSLFFFTRMSNIIRFLSLLLTYFSSSLALKSSFDFITENKWLAGCWLPVFDLNMLDSSPYKSVRSLLKEYDSRYRDKFSSVFMTSVYKLESKTITDNIPVPQTKNQNIWSCDQPMRILQLGQGGQMIDIGLFLKVVRFFDFSF
ncbi:hypothetical protein IVU49_14125 [Salmonella enterica subsp. enterica serovar Worthington]|nr:hypothetical protein [Salmonella enterica subsp. enterica serovar Worthington]MBP1522005.1 hypothetical protein [Salmonella enterica subsp. enterica serovar Worthington]MBP1522009.1 hypothetical protein [Salmonella enterica subsp. enterica serovar Worthington]MBP1522914.1 hypothetical protein [Salmonella enterica subsp. enterica serovar Worthington]MBP1522919.1 hypothetical protein [Salmonella enterica subsp. enterica serovar Worthington]